MINKLMQIIAPHYCYGCGKVGSPLCPECKYDIVEESQAACIVCAAPSSVGVCGIHQTSYERAWVVGSRDGTLKKVIDALKFERVAGAAESLASLLDSVLPVLPVNTVVIALPTIPTHIRQRGYDQTLLIARHFARLRNLTLVQALARTDSTVQRGQTKQERLRQARTAFKSTKWLDPSLTYLLIDDVVTTNASVRYAAEELRNAGATTVWVAVLARQELDKSP